MDIIHTARRHRRMSEAGEHHNDARPLGFWKPQTLAKVKRAASKAQRRLDKAIAEGRGHTRHAQKAVVTATRELDWRGT